MLHVDEFIDDSFTYKTEPEKYARFVLNYFRMPATLKMDFEPFMQDYKLFCDYNGLKHKVTGASRLGSVFLAKNLNRDIGYDLAVSVEECSNWSN